MSSPTRWAGVSQSARRAERRALLVAAGFALFGSGGESTVTVRSVCREAGLNSRYFYDWFATTDELLGAVYDDVAAQLGEIVSAAMESAGEDRRPRTRAGIRAVLTFTAEEPARGRVLFVGARANSVLAERRSAAQEVLYGLVVLEDSRLHTDANPISAKVGAALFTGAMSELVNQWLLGSLGSDVDAVTDYALKRVLIAN